MSDVFKKVDLRSIPIGAVPRSDPQAFEAMEGLFREGRQDAARRQRRQRRGQRACRGRADEGLYVAAAASGCRTGEDAKCTARRAAISPTGCRARCRRSRSSARRAADGVHQRRRRGHGVRAASVRLRQSGGHARRPQHVGQFRQRRARRPGGEIARHARRSA